MLRVGIRSKDAPASPHSSQLPAKEAGQACVTTADELASHGHRREAIQLYERARHFNARLNVAHKLAVLYDQEGSDTLALAEYNKALKRDPTNADLQNDLGYFYYQRHDLAQAEHWLMKALERNAEHPQALVNLGMVRGYQGRYQESFEAFEKVVGPIAAQSNIGMILAKQGRHQEAIPCLRQALARDPRITQAKAVLAYLERNPN
jgi:tetratricopeptide (TPR) repeat protein